MNSMNSTGMNGMPKNGNAPPPMAGGRRSRKNNNNNGNYEGGKKRNNNNNNGNNQEGGAKLPAVGTKAMVYHGTARHTSGGLTKKDLMKTKKGRIVSRKKHAAGKKALKNLVKAGYKAKKGTFKLFKK
jgi:hypothetical protein